MSALPQLLTARSALPGMVFPGIPAAQVLPRLALYHQLESSQWLSPDELQKYQFEQLEALLEHVRASVPAYRGRLQAAGLDAPAHLTAPAWRRIPLLTRRELQDQGLQLCSHAPPPEHGSAGKLRTSGSTGEPVEVHRSGLNLLMWEAITLRDHGWHGRDFTGTLCAIRASGPHGQAESGHATWGSPTQGLYETGPAYLLPVDTPIPQQVDWLRQRNPHYLVTYPSNLAALLLTLSRDMLPRLREVRSIGESLSDDLRSQAHEQLGVQVTDLYSSNEVGYIALQCPDSGLYHIQSESLLVEVLDAAGQHCQPGEIGRVVVTTLHNFVQPLLRYELRDHAEVGPPCPCGRGLPTLRRILGRSRNLVALPDGTQRWPRVGFAEYRSIAPVRQYQLIQRSLERITMRLVVDQPLQAEQEKALRELVQHKLRHGFAVDFEYFPDRLPLGPSGKFEEFVCEVAGEGRP